MAYSIRVSYETKASSLHYIQYKLLEEVHCISYVF